MIRSVTGALPDAAVSIEFHDGTRSARIDADENERKVGSGRETAGAAPATAAQAEPGGATTVTARDHPEPTKTRRKPVVKPRDRDKQGSLF
jgi:hypothetical protein